MPDNLSPALLKVLQGLKPVRHFPKGATLFQQGAAATGVYLLESGEVRLLLPTGANQQQLLEVAGPGSLLGISESMSGEEYRTTAEASEPTAAIFVPREEFLAFLSEDVDLCMQIVRMLSEDLHGLYHIFRSISAHPGRPRQRSLEEQLN
jgi:CRP-like cAMP-binding protein